MGSLVIWRAITTRGTDWERKECQILSLSLSKYAEMMRFFFFFERKKKRIKKTRFYLFYFFDFSSFFFSFFYLNGNKTPGAIGTTGSQLGG
jgi:hypothetical protein